MGYVDLPEGVEYGFQVRCGGAFAGDQRGGNRFINLKALFLEN